MNVHDLAIAHCPFSFYKDILTKQQGSDGVSIIKMVDLHKAPGQDFILTSIKENPIASVITFGLFNTPGAGYNTLPPLFSVGSQGVQTAARSTCITINCNATDLWIEDPIPNRPKLFNTPTSLAVPAINKNQLVSNSV